MTIKSSGSLSMDEINAEFGLGNNLGAYRGVGYWNSSGDYTTLPTTNISFANFYGASYGLPAVYYTSFASNGTDTGTYTFTGVNIGTALPHRRVFVCAHAYLNNNISRGLSSITVNGTPLTLHVGNGVGVYGAILGIGSAKVSSGTTADIVVNWTGGVYHCGIGVYSGYFLQQTSPYSIRFAGFGDNVNPATTTIDLPDKGICIAGISTYRYVSHTETWSGSAGLIESYDGYFAGGTNWSGGYATRNSSAVNGATITVTDSNGSVDQKYIAALSWK